VDRLPVLVALDLPSVDQAFSVAQATSEFVQGFKIGQKLLHEPGIHLVMDAIMRMDSELFLDAKIFDIPETVYQGVKSIAARGVHYTTVYGDSTVVEAAVRASRSTSTRVLLVTVLTSWNQLNLLEMGITHGLPDLVVSRAQMASDLGCPGIICSAQDRPNDIRKQIGNPGLLAVTPGIRPKGSESHDQQRICTPREALEAGSDLLVIGRPIWDTPDPRAVLEQMALDLL
jgi:orotidine-5'-phosphate decarboxylase